MKLAVVGTGYVGLVVGACFADHGNDVVCVDNNPAKVAGLQRGEIPIYEPGLSEMVARNTAEDRLSFTTELAPAVQASDIIFVAVGTPQEEDGSADLRHVLAVAEGIGRAMNGFKIVVNKSTVPVGTSRLVREAIESVTTHPVAVVSNPEFLKEGAAIDDFVRPDRVVVGTDDPQVENVMRRLYEPFVRTGHPILVMDPASAELSKYASNAMLAARISFMNDMAGLCERVGADVAEVRAGMGSDSRIGPSFLFPGVGYGGSCFPKDVKALIEMGRAHGVAMNVVEAVEKTNELQKTSLVPRLERHFGNLAGRHVAVWGLAFKPRTDDIREAPALATIEALLAKGATVAAYDPKAMEHARAVLGDRVVFARRSYDALPGADALLILTEWNDFREPDFAKVKRLLKQPVIFDGRNIYNPDELRALGFHYEGIGRR